MADEQASSAAEVAEDIEQILAAEADGAYDLAPATVRWLMDGLDWFVERVRVAEMKVSG